MLTILADVIRAVTGQYSPADGRNHADHPRGAALRRPA